METVTFNLKTQEKSLIKRMRENGINRLRIRRKWCLEKSESIWKTERWGRSIMSINTKKRNRSWLEIDFEIILKIIKSIPKSVFEYVCHWGSCWKFYMLLEWTQEIIQGMVQLHTKGLPWKSYILLLGIYHFTLSILLKLKPANK